MTGTWNSSLSRTAIYADGQVKWAWIRSNLIFVSGSTDELHGTVSQISFSACWLKRGSASSGAGKNTAGNTRSHCRLLVIRAVAIAWIQPKTKRYRAYDNNFFEKWFERLTLVFYKTRTYITMVLIGEVRGKHKQCQVPGPAFFCIG